MLTERRLSDSHLFRGAREIEVFGDSQEISQLSEFDPWRVLVDVGPSAFLVQRHGTAGLSVACQFSPPSSCEIPSGRQSDRISQATGLSAGPPRRSRGGMLHRGVP